MCDLVNFSSSILAYYGCQAKHKTMPLMDEALNKNKKNVIVMVFDGMGITCLEEHLPKDSFLRRHLVSEFSSVFPPTTTAALTTIESGLSPAEHGWLGWTMHFPEVKKNVAIFPNTCNGKQASEEHLARKYMPYQSILEQIRSAGNADAVSVSPYGEQKITSLCEGMAFLKDFCEVGGRRYLYFYWPEPDFTTHGFGCKSDETKQLVLEINHEVEKLCQSLKDTLVIVTADHGLVDIHYKAVCNNPVLKKCLKYPPVIETRCASFHVKEGARETFVKEFWATMGENFKLLTHQEVMEQHIFGEGEMNSRTEEAIGDFLAIATGEDTIIYRKEHKPYKAAHAGGVKAESRIPFICIET